MISLKFLFGFITIAVVFLFALVIFNSVIEYKVTETEKCDTNCLVNYNGVDCTSCKTNSNDTLLVIIVPLSAISVSVIILLVVFDTFGNGFKLFGGLGGKDNHSGGGVLPVALFFPSKTEEELRQEGWKGVNDFE